MHLLHDELRVVVVVAVGCLPANGKEEDIARCCTQMKQFVFSLAHLEERG